MGVLVLQQLLPGVGEPGLARHGTQLCRCSWVFRSLCLAGVFAPSLSAIRPSASSPAPQAAVGNTQPPCPGTTWHLLCCPSPSGHGPLPGRAEGRKAGADQTAAAARISPCLSLQSLRETFSLLSLAAFGSIGPGESQSTALTHPSSFKCLNPHCFPPWAFDPAPKLERFCPGQIPRETIHSEASRAGKGNLQLQ